MEESTGKMVLHTWHKKDKNHAIKVPQYRQRTNYDCGPTSLKMVLAHYGKIISVKKLRNLCKTSPENGTGPTGLKKAARRLGFSVWDKNNASIKDLKKYTLLHPVIVHYVAWGGGHYSVVIGVSKDRVLIADPSKHGIIRTVNKSRFLKYWVDENINDKPPHRRWLLVVKPKKKIAA